MGIDQQASGQHLSRVATPAAPPGPKFAVDIALAEFNALRAEITTRMTAQAALVGVGLTALGVIVGFVVKENGDPRLLLAIPPLAAGVNFLWAVENRQIGQLGRYIRIDLWQHLKAWTGIELPSWEGLAAQRRVGFWNVVRSIFTDFTTTLIFAGAAVASQIVLIDGVRIGNRVVKVGSTLWALDWVATALALVVPFAMTRGNWRRAETSTGGAEEGRPG
jgi:hypothetical protein